MAKCPICNSRQGKRKCFLVDDLICSRCCVSKRKAEVCSECGFYQKPKIKYNNVPAYSTSEMESDMDLESYGNSVEGALCAYDIEIGNMLNDSDAIRIIELLINIYHFNVQDIEGESQTVINGVGFIEGTIKEDLKDVNNDVIVKILGVIRFVAKRRSKTGKEYMRLIHQYVGPRISSGLRILKR